MTQLVQRTAAQRKIDWYRARAEECAAAAKIAIDPGVKAFNEAAAQRWLRLAEGTERAQVIEPTTALP